MRHRFAIVLSATGVVAATASADTSYTVTPIGGTVGSFFDDGLVHGHTFNFTDGSPGGGAAGQQPFDLYDNVPTFLGGTSDPGSFGPLGAIQGTYLFMDWNFSLAHWGDDLHDVSGGTPHTTTSLWYGYSATGAGSLTHVIKIYDMIPPSVPHTSPGGATYVPITKGFLLTSLTLTGLPAGQNFVQVDVPSVLSPGSAVWIKFEDSGPAAADTLWLTGGSPVHGYTHPGVTFTLKDYYPTYYGGTRTYNTFANFADFVFPDGAGGYAYASSNVVAGVGGYNLNPPAPPTIALLALGGLMTLRRRRS